MAAISLLSVEKLESREENPGAHFILEKSESTSGLQTAGNPQIHVHCVCLCFI
jgi:hypothetical protein